MTRARCALTVLIVLVASCVAFASRTVVVLDHNWQGVTVEGRSAGESVPESGWSAGEVPYCHGGKSVWLKRAVRVEEAWRGRRVALWFEQANYRTRVWVNGRLCGGHDGAFGSFEIELTEAVEFGRDNEIAVAISGPPANEHGQSPDALGYGQSWVWGVYGPIELRVTDPVYIRDVFIVPSVRKQSLTVEVEATAAEALAAQFVVCDAEGAVVLESPAAALDGQGKGEVRAAWPDPRLWSPEDPYLHELTLRLLRDGKVIDEVRRRFGFREFWTEGAQFRLNGRRINLRGDGWHWRGLVSREWIRTLFTTLKRAGINIYRGHGPHEDSWLEMADEMGMLLAAEGPVHQMQYLDVGHPAFWSNVQRTYHEWVRRVRNHPSVVLYSADNEVANGYESLGGYSPEKEAAHRADERVGWVLRFAGFIREVDPTRPIMHEGDGGLNGEADVINLHYPHEAPFWHLYPQTTYWLADQPAECTWKYEPPDGRRPVYIGEFGRNFDASPRSVAFMVSDSAYVDVKSYYRGLGRIMREAIIGFRACDVAGIAPWNTSVYGLYWPDGGEPQPNGLYEGITEGFVPEAVFVKEHYTRLYGNDRLKRTVLAFNDTLADREYELVWRLTDEAGGVVGEGRRELRLDAGEHAEVTLDRELPDCNTTTALNLVIEFRRDGCAVGSTTQALRLFARKAAGVADREVLLYDPAKAAEAALKAAGLRVRTVAKMPETMPRGGVLVVGPNALTDEVAAECERLAGGGAHVIVLAQDRWPDGWLGLSQPGSPIACTLAFAIDPANPAFAGLEADDLKYWAADHVVCRNLLVKPDRGPLVALAESGGNRLGLKLTPLAQGRVGSGRISVCQLDVTGKLAVEPAARQILLNLIGQPVEVRAERRVAVIAEAADLIAPLRDAGLIGMDSVAASQPVPQSADLVILDGRLLASMSEARVDALARSAEGGSTILVTAVEPAGVERLSRLIGQPVRLSGCECFQAAKAGDDLLVSGISHEDLCWVVYDEWGSEFRNEDNRRWAIASHAIASPIEGGRVLLTSAEVILNGQWYGDGIVQRPPTYQFTDGGQPLMVSVIRGRGRIVLCQLNLHDPAQATEIPLPGHRLWEQDRYDPRRVRTRILATLLANLGADLKGAE